MGNSIYLKNGSTKDGDSIFNMVSVKLRVGDKDQFVELLNKFQFNEQDALDPPMKFFLVLWAKDKKQQGEIKFVDIFFNYIKDGRSTEENIKEFKESCVLFKEI